MNIYNVEYIFYFSNRNIRKYKISVDKKTKRIVNSNFSSTNDLEWTNLEFCKCQNCSLNSEENTKCPMAVHLNSLVTAFSDKISYNEIDITVITDQRTYKKNATFQYGLQSLFGLVMATSGCPHMEFFSQMALSHLPFSNMDETMTRATSFYLLSQYFKKQDCKDYDFSMHGLKNIYNEIEQVNHGIIKRIRSKVQAGDANQNAIATLNSFAQMFNVQYEINLENISYQFKK